MKKKVIKPLKKSGAKKVLEEKDWTESDFVKHLSSIMKRQELENPELGYVHERLAPEYEAIRTLIENLLHVESDAEETEMIKKIKAHRNKALLPLIDFILQLKKMKNEP